jgi:hypothetical protein
MKEEDEINVEKSKNSMKRRINILAEWKEGKGGTWGGEASSL